MPQERWYQFAIDEIDKAAKAFPRRLRHNDREFIESIRQRAKYFSLTEGQERYLLQIRERMTQATRIKWR